MATPVSVKHVLSKTKNQHGKNQHGKNQHTLVLSGDLTVYGVKAAFEEMWTKQTLTNKSVVLDLAGVTELDGAGLQLLLHLKKSLAPKKLEVSAVNPALEPIFELLQVQWQDLSSIRRDSAVD